MELRIVGTTDDPVPVIPIDPDVSFEDFYLLFPRHEARKDARRAWDKVARPDHIAIMTALCAWRQVWADRGEGTRFTPLPASWLNGERWTDELPPGYTLMPRISAKTPVVVQPEGERVPMPEHVRLMLAKLKEGKKS